MWARLGLGCSACALLIIASGPLTQALRGGTPVSETEAASLVGGAICENWSTHTCRSMATPPNPRCYPVSFYRRNSLGSVVHQKEKTAFPCGNFPVEDPICGVVFNIEDCSL